MTTPIDTTRLRADAEAVRDAGVKSAYAHHAVRRLVDAGHSDFTSVCKDAWDAAEALRAAQKALYCDAPPDSIILALLDEVEGLRARLDEAYPRALQAAAGVVFRYDLSSAVLDMEDEDDVAAAMDALADDILELSAEQIEAYDAKVERDHAEAVAPKTERPVVIWHYRNDEEDLPSCDDPDEALVNAIDEQAGLVYVDDSGTQRLEEPHLLDDEITLYGFARMPVKVDGERILENVLENLDDDHGQPGPGPGTKPTPAMTEAAHAFAIAIEDGYESWACEVIEKRVVNVREWCAVHRPDWLAQLPAIESEEGGEHG